MLTKTAESTSAPEEALIPEAREHQRRRYVRSGLFAAIGALVVGALIVAAVVLFGGPFASGKSSVPDPVGIRAGTHPGTVYFRPVLCFAPPYSPTGTGLITAVPFCSAVSELTQQNLNVMPNTFPQGYTSNNVPVDPFLASVPSTKSSADKPTSTVLLPGLTEVGHPSNAERYVLGPAEMSARAIASASAEKNQVGQWVVNYTTTTTGGALWDKVAADNFHQFIAVELNGFVYSAPIIQPTQNHFSSFDGRGEISGDLTKAEAARLASALRGSK